MDICPVYYIFCLIWNTIEVEREYYIIIILGVQE